MQVEGSAFGLCGSPLFDYLYCFSIMVSNVSNVSFMLLRTVHLLYSFIKELVLRRDVLDDCFSEHITPLR